MAALPDPTTDLIRSCKSSSLLALVRPNRLPWLPCEPSHFLEVLVGCCGLWVLYGLHTVL